MRGNLIRFIFFSSRLAAEGEKLEAPLEILTNLKTVSWIFKRRYVSLINSSCMDGETIIQIRLRPHALSFFFFGGIITMLDAAAATDVRGSARSDTRRENIVKLNLTQWISKSTVKAIIEIELHEPTGSNALFQLSSRTSTQASTPRFAELIINVKSFSM